jgi:hypothetical protein
MIKIKFFSVKIFFCNHYFSPLKTSSLLWEKGRIRIRIRKTAFIQGCGSGSGSVLDPYSIGSVDPDPDP